MPATAQKAYRVLTTQFFDAQEGGFFMELTPDNRPANDIKHTYAQAFAIYALGKYYEFNPATEVLSLIHKPSAC